MARYDNETCDWHTTEHAGLPEREAGWREFVTINYEGLSFRIHGTDSGFMPRETRDELAKFQGSLRCVVDIGAHVGTFALQAARALEENVRVNGFEHRIRCVKAAVAADASGKAALRSSFVHGTGQKSLVFKNKYRVEEYVETISLHDLLSGVLEVNGYHIDFLKVDIEGEEFRIAEAGPEPLLKHVSYISMSLHTPTNTEYYDYAEPRITQDCYYRRIIQWLIDSGVKNGRIDKHKAIVRPL
jgi:FkbM family methyltransferase